MPPVVSDFDNYASSWPGCSSFPLEMKETHLSDEQLQPHPLLMDHVISQVLLSMDSDLLGHYCKIFRLVCKDWSRVATRIYKAKRGKIVFKGNFIGKVSVLFNRIMATSSNIPFQTYKFCPDSYDESAFNEVMYICGASISTLELQLVNPSPKLTFPKTFPCLVLGRLSRIVFHMRMDPRSDHGPPQAEMASLLKNLFEISPNLTSLEIKVLRGVVNSTRPRDLELHLQAQEKVGDVVAHFLPDRIRNLKLHISFSDAQLRALSKRSLHLLSLDLYLQQSQVSKEAMELFFVKVCPQLVSCRVLGTQLIENQVAFPIFSKLRTLSGLGKAPSYVQYEKLFPALENLDICLWDNSEDIFPSNCYSSSLQSVKFPFQIDSAVVFERMGSCFPNLKKLSDITVTSPDALLAIFAGLPNLQVLSLVLGYGLQNCWLDGLLTGMVGPPVMYKYCDAKVREEIERRCRKACLRDLKELRKLSILAAPLTLASSVKITDMSVQHAFLQLKNLSVITLDYFPISTPCLELLQKHARLERPI